MLTMTALTIVTLRGTVTSPRALTGAFCLLAVPWQETVLRQVQKALWLSQRGSESVMDQISEAGSWLAESLTSTVDLTIV